MFETEWMFFKRCDFLSDFFSWLWFFTLPRACCVLLLGTAASSTLIQNCVSERTVCSFIFEVLHVCVFVFGSSSEWPDFIQVRDKEANIDNLINPIEDMYALLTKYQVAVPKEESDLVSDLPYSWKKLRKLATELSNKLAKLQAGFKRELIQQVNVFVVEAKSFK